MPASNPVLVSHQTAYMQTIKAKFNKDLNPSQAKRKRLERGQPLEGFLFVANFILSVALLLVPSGIIVYTEAEPLPAAPLCIAVGMARCLQIPALAVLKTRLAVQHYTHNAWVCRRLFFG